MLLFCPTCANVLMIQEGIGSYRFACETCPYVHNVRRKVTTKKFTKPKSVDDVLGGEAAWENASTTSATCPQCSHGKAFFYLMQTRSADEPMTEYYRCCGCKNRWNN